jgi:hypothetical protein
MKNRTQKHIKKTYEVNKKKKACCLSLLFNKRFIYNCTSANKSHFFNFASHLLYFTAIKQKVFFFL